jgi:endonuclease YncB( thermonuclease family)
MRPDTTDAAEAAMQKAIECKVLEVTTAGELRITIGDRARAVRLRGVVVPAEAASAANTLIQRLRQPPASVRCTVAPEDVASALPATIEYLAWRDKSGDVWKDLAATLLEQGLARVVPQEAPDVEGYRARERKAREARRGLWSKPPNP